MINLFTKPLPVDIADDRDYNNVTASTLVVTTLY